MTQSGPISPMAQWRETLATLHLWTQIVGKIRLTLTPWLNHGWQAPLYVTARGLGTSPIPIGAEIFEIEFDFVGHRLMVRTSRGAERSLPLAAAVGRRFLSCDRRSSRQRRRCGRNQRDAERSSEPDPLFAGPNPRRL